MIKTKVILLLVLGIAADNSLSDHGQTASPTVDAMERSLETSRHEQLLARITKNDTVMNKFTTDGCSGGLSAGWEQMAARFPEFAVQYGTLPPWQECCVIHDQKYHVGGAGGLSATESFEQRKAADLALKACVVKTGMQRSDILRDIHGLSENEVSNLYEIVSELMYRAVRVGGIPCTDLPWRWGYGWPLCSQSSD